MSEHISKTADCLTCHHNIELMDGIKDPYWRHTGGNYSHPARPTPDSIRETTR